MHGILTSTLIGAWTLAGWGGGHPVSPRPKPQQTHVDVPIPFPIGTVDDPHVAPPARRDTADAAALPRRPSPVKGWYQLTNEPGTWGFGALNERGEVVVEQRRFVASRAPVVIQRFPVPACPNGQCPTTTYSRNGRFGRR